MGEMMTGTWGYARSATAAAALLALTACGEDGFQFPTFGEEAASGPVIQADGSVQLVETDVEAPEVFQVTEPGLWDGRPSLGGVWVAHPSVTDPERVIIRNPANGTFVIGALFRRERENPGPSLQVSSDAAAALEMLAGSPTTLNVTALRREEQAAPVATEATSPEAVALDASPAIESTTLDPIAGAAAAIDAAEAAQAAAPAPAPAPAPAAASSLDRPFIQLGIFSVEENANNTRIAMEGRGLPARVVAQESQGRQFWRVIVGPATSEGQRSGYLDTVKSAGFNDAYFVRN